MTQDVISNWVEKAKAVSDDAHKTSGVQVIRRMDTKSRKTTGETILEIAESICPGLMKLLVGVRDEEGMIMQPAHVRGIALNVAQGLVKKGHDDKKTA